jgi:multidrug resistance protein MdtO
MFCYISYMAIDWFGIHTALITCTFIALESTGATLHKGLLRMGGCIIGGALALFTIVFLMPHMVTIASLVVVVACASAIAGWVATGSEMISYAGLQIAFAFFYSVFQGYAPDTDLDNVRNRASATCAAGRDCPAANFHRNREGGSALSDSGNLKEF